MRRWSSPAIRFAGPLCAALLALACLVASSEGAAAQAQAQPGAPARNPWLELFGVRQPPPQEAPAQPRRTTRPRPATSAASANESASAEPRGEVPITHRIVVFGDSLAHNLGTGLADVMADSPHVAVTTRARGSSGLVRDDFHDWRTEIEPFLTADPPFDIGVVMVGLNDRQELAAPEGRLTPLTEAWKEAYGARVDTILARFSEARKPLVWVGLPPMSGSRLSTDLQVVNEVIRARVRASGGVFVDIWQGFVDDDDRYTANGPTLEGRIARMRASDGIHFTPAGSRKAAHFVDVEIQRLIAADGPAPSLARQDLPARPLVPEPVDIDEIMAHLVGPLVAPEEQGPALLPQTPAAPPIGPVLPLTGVERAAGGRIVSERPRVDRAARLATERVLSDGLAPAPVPGRADDFSWPRERPVGTVMQPD